MNSPRLILIGVAALAASIAVGWYLKEDPKVEHSKSASSAPANPVLRKESLTSPVVSIAIPEGRLEENSVPTGALAEVLKMQNLFERRHALERLGYDNAKLGAPVALGKLAEISTGPERAAFLRGMFAQLAEGNPTDALRAIKAIPAGPDRTAGLTALVVNWQPEVEFALNKGIIAMNRDRELELDQSKDIFAMNLGSSEASLIGRLLQNPSLAVGSARELLTGKELTQILSSAAYMEASRDPQRALSFGQDLQGAERAQFLESVARGWAKADGAAALAWVLEEPDPILRERLRRETLLSWGQSDPAAAARQVAGISDPAWRKEALEKIAGIWAINDTGAALAWANGLPDPQQRDQAVASIQNSAPVGIGVVLNTSDGLPSIADVLPGGSASAGGILKPGYQIAAIGDGRGGFTDLQGAKLDEVAKMIRGKAGTSVALQVIPPGGTPANRITVMVPRQQLMFKNPAPNAKP